MGIIRGLAVLGLSLGISSSSAVMAYAEEVFLKVGFSAGAGYDLRARLVAQHLPRYLDGKPEIIVQNVPGAGSLSLGMRLFSAEPADGSVLGLVSSGILVMPLLDPAAPDFNPARFEPVGSLVYEPTICSVPVDSGVGTLEQFLTEEFLLGASGRGSPTYQYAALVRHIFDAKYRIVTGFPGARETRAAALSGEVQGGLRSRPRYLPAFRPGGG